MSKKHHSRDMRDANRTMGESLCVADVGSILAAVEAGVSSSDISRAFGVPMRRIDRLKTTYFLFVDAGLMPPVVST